MRLTVKPRDLRPGDLIPLADDDLFVQDVPVETVEKIRPGGATRYKVTLSGSTQPLYFAPSANITITHAEGTQS